MCCQSGRRCADRTGKQFAGAVLQADYTEKMVGGMIMSNSLEA